MRHEYKLRRIPEEEVRLFVRDGLESHAEAAFLALRTLRKPKTKTIRPGRL